MTTHRLFRAAAWRKSSYSNPNQNCVEVATVGEAAGVRDSKNPAAGAITLGAEAWAAFRTTVQRGDLDL